MADAENQEDPQAVWWFPSPARTADEIESALYDDRNYMTKLYLFTAPTFLQDIRDVRARFGHDKDRGCARDTIRGDVNRRFWALMWLYSEEYNIPFSLAIRQVNRAVKKDEEFSKHDVDSVCRARCRELGYDSVDDVQRAFWDSATALLDKYELNPLWWRVLVWYIVRGDLTRVDEQIDSHVEDIEEAKTHGYERGSARQILLGEYWKDWRVLGLFQTHGIEVNYILEDEETGRPKKVRHIYDDDDAVLVGKRWRAKVRGRDPKSARDRLQPTLLRTLWARARQTKKKVQPDPQSSGWQGIALEWKGLTGESKRPITLARDVADLNTLQDLSP